MPRYILPRQDDKLGRTEWDSLANPRICRDFTWKLRKYAIEESLVAITSHRTLAG